MTIEERAKAHEEDIVCNALWSDIEFQSDATMAVCDFVQAYLQGAKDEEDNPPWRKCEDELPPMRQNVLIAKADKKTQRISVHIASRHPSDCRYPNEKWIWSGNFLPNNVVAWLPLPKFNSEIKNFYGGKQ